MLLVFMSKHFLLLLHTRKMFILFYEDGGEYRGNNNAHSKTDQTRPANQFDIHFLSFYIIIIAVVVMWRVVCIK